MSKPSAYSKAAVKKVDADDHLKRTQARIQQIQSHLSKTPRGSRLKGKVCIITGVGSMKGIGYANIHKKLPSTPLNAFVDSQAAALLYAHEGNKYSVFLQLLYDLMWIFCTGAEHLYLIDFSPDNLPNLKSTIENLYSDVKVSTVIPSRALNLRYLQQVTVIEADAADDEAIAGVCQQAVNEEGKLDVFFANVSR